MSTLTCSFLFTYLVGFALTSVASENLEWSYEGKQGPTYWGDLSDKFDICKRGLNQSPVNLIADADAELPELRFEYTVPGALIEINTGHAIQEKVQPGNYLWFKGVRYELKQFHFHSPSEHSVSDEYFPMEVHLVHQSDQGNYAVVGILFEEGERNELMDQLPSFRQKRGEDPAGNPIDYNLLFPNRRSYYYYNGSLTTPPCTEGVAWMVLKTPVVASKSQIQHYHDLLGFDNNRPVQPKNSRLIVH